LEGWFNALPNLRFALCAARILLRPKTVPRSAPPFFTQTVMAETGEHGAYAGCPTPVFCIFLLLSILSCSDVSGKLSILEGNFYQMRGLSNQAIAAYLKAASHPETKAYAEFGLGAVYHSLDEREAALERFKDAEATVNSAPRQEHQELLYRIRYNSGIIVFESGRYDEAASCFRQALELNPSRVEAKRNLELSLAARRHEERDPKSKAGEGQKQENAETDALFEYLREKERRQWKSREWIEDAPEDGPDY
jgi:Ca-activated chloride channel family protein